MKRIISVRIWLWKIRYALRIHKRGRDEDGSRLPWTFCIESADAAWEWATDTRFGGDPIQEVLTRDPAEEADEELSNWDPT